MTEFLTNYGLFLSKIVTVVVAILILVGAIVAMSRKERSGEKLEIRNLNDKYDHMRMAIQSQIMHKKEYKALSKEDKQKRKAEKKQPRDTKKKTIYVLDFHGDLKASAVSSLREEITAVLTMAGKKDEVVLRLENTGGVVHEHGLAASQLTRLREARIPLTIIVDKVAASGGYMMACVADRILAAPFAVVGSIGVLAQLPNFNELLTRHGITFEQQTAGEYKRTVTMFGKNTEKERQKLKQQIEETHDLFKDFVANHRPKLDLAKVATGEYWYGSTALELGLVDALTTSDDYLLANSGKARLFEVKYSGKKSLSERLMSSISTGVDRAFWAWREATQRPPYT